MYTWIRLHLNIIIKQELNAGKRFIVCPYGECGMLLVDLLEKAYGISDVIILDNGLSQYNSAIHPISDLEKLDVKDRVLIITAISMKNSEEIEKQLSELNVDIKTRNILEPEICDSPEKESYFREIKKRMCCRKVKEKSLIRVGSVGGDGGYIMIDDFNDDMHAYSFGIGNDVSWDMDIASKGIRVFMYDHTIVGLPLLHPKFRFYRLGVGEEQGCMPLKELLEENNDLDNDNLILKMDIEGAEWDVINKIPTELLNNFRQISLELHDMCKSENKEIILKVLQKINVTHQIIWVHGNNAGKAEIANGVLIPNLIEVTYVRKNTYLFEDEDKCEFPTSLDLPNLINRRDFNLGNWGGDCLKTKADADMR